MGSSVSRVVEDAKKKSEAEETKAKDVLNMLQQIGEDKKSLFYNEVKEKIDKEIPIDKIIKYDYMIRCSASQNADDLKKGLTDVVKSFASGNWISGLTGTISLGIDAVFSGFSGNSSEKRDTTVVLGPLGGITKIDYYFYAYQIQTVGLVSGCQSVLVVAYCISSVKASDVDLDTILVLAEANLARANPPLKVDVMKDTINEFKERLKEEQKSH